MLHLCRIYYNYTLPIFSLFSFREMVVVSELILTAPQLTTIGLSEFLVATLGRLCDSATWRGWIVESPFVHWCIFRLPSDVLVATCRRRKEKLKM